MSVAQFMSTKPKHVWVVENKYDSAFADVYPGKLGKRKAAKLCELCWGANYRVAKYVPTKGKK